MKTVGWFSNEKIMNMIISKVLIFKLLDYPFPGIFNYINQKSILSFLYKNKINNINIVHGHVHILRVLLNYIVEHFDQRDFTTSWFDVLQLNVGRISLLRNIHRNYIIKFYKAIK